MDRYASTKPAQENAGAGTGIAIALLALAAGEYAFALGYAACAVRAASGIFPQWQPAFHRALSHEEPFIRSFSTPTALAVGSNESYKL